MPEFFVPTDISEALELKKSSKGSFYLAGGTVPNSEYSKREDVLTLISLRSLDMKRADGDCTGSMTTLQEIVENKKLHPGLRRSALDVSNRNIRNCATIGGNIGANKAGSDLIGTLIALDAELAVYSEDAAGKTAIPVRDWIRSPQGLIEEVIIKELSREIFIRRYSRTRNDLPLLKFTAGYKVDNGIVEDIVIALASVSDTVITLGNTADLMNGARVSELDRETIINTAQAEMHPVDDHRASSWYRRELLTASIRELIEQICG